MKILIVDDNAAIRRMTRNLLAGIASEVYECSDGAQALVAYRRTTPDLVLMDIRMDQCDGLTATGLIKAQDPHARIIIVTNHDQVELRDAARAAGAEAYVLKEDLMSLRELLAE